MTTTTTTARTARCRVHDGFILSIILTAIPFWLVMAKVIADRNAAVLVLGAFAVVQIMGATWCTSCT